MRNVIVLVVASLSLVSCSTFGDMDAGLDGLKGQPAQAAFAKLGIPKSEGVIAGRKFYAWGTSFQTSSPVVNTSNTYGQVGGTPYSATTTGTQWTTDSYDCAVRIFVDADEVIQNYDYQGNLGGCHGYGKALKR